ncbi:hypothetical protein V1387_17905 [Allomuricauda taeanensis]|uniref:hypothetical protein n=1 Tax=Flagellimonas taeanensis TaxID=1005926 RepID=UPI002E7B6B82|nr:hypothetical protein [Allomuricauda taeanensis]MEE1964568.1 hypothetical protein [Allomuricauda taeanensis]
MDDKTNNLIEQKRRADYNRYMDLAAMGTYLILSPKKSQAKSPAPPGIVFDDG